MTEQNGTALVARAEQTSREVSAFGSDTGFDTAQRVARALSSSTVVPEAYRNNLPNVLVAMEYANRLGASVLAVMQNLDVIQGRPGLRATFLIGTVNASGRFSPIRFRFQGDEGKDSWGCRAWATDRESREECVGPLITIATAKAEGWYNKSGSKWKTIPELMLMYRAGAWWTRVFCPELSLGLHTSDELEDSYAYPDIDPVQAAASALDAPDVIPTIPGVPVEDDAGEASKAQLKQLAALREKARAADAIDMDLESRVEEALKLKDGGSVSAAIRDLNQALIGAASDGQNGLELT